MRIKQTFFVAAALLMLLTSCSKRDTLNSFSSDLFPHEVGSSWRYAYSDSNGFLDTVTYKVVEANRLMPNLLYADVWAIDKQVQQTSDTIFVRVTTDSIIFYKPYLYGPERVWPLPLTSGTSWFDTGNMGLTTDSVAVLEPYTIVVPAGSFPNTFSIYRQQSYQGSYTSDYYWLSPNVGITRISKEQFTIPSVPPVQTYTEEMVLLDYHF